MTHERVTRIGVCLFSFAALAFASGCSVRGALNQPCADSASGNKPTLSTPAFYLPIGGANEIAVVDPTTDEIKAVDPLIRGFHVVAGPNLIVADPVRPRIYLVATVDGTPKFLVFSTGLRPGVTSSTTLPSQTVTGGFKLAITPKGTRSSFRR